MSLFFFRGIGLKRIVDIKQQRNKRRYTLYFENGEWLGLFDEILLKHGLKIGQEVDSSFLEELSREEDRKKAMELSLRYLGYRARSEKEMEVYLRGKGFEDPTIEDCLSRLESYGYVDDLAFARSWVKSRLKSKHSGRALIRNELLQKGIKGHVLDKALMDIDGDIELEGAFALKDKYMRRYEGLSQEDKKRKLHGLLSRRGHSWNTISQVLRTIDDEEDEFY